MNDQLTINKEAYLKIKHDLESKDFGRVALMHDGKVIYIFNNGNDAYMIGLDKYGLGNFSLQKIGDKPISLGIHGFFNTQGPH